MKPAGLALSIALALSACSSNPNKDSDPGPAAGQTVSGTPARGTPEDLYLKAKKALNKNQYESAVEKFENLEATFPFGDFAAQARLDIAYAYFKLSELDNATAAIDRFLKLYPNSDQGDYAYYLKGLVNFSRGKSLFEKIFPRKMHQLDQTALRASFGDFSTLVRKYPDSIYAEDAKHRMIFLRNEMARHELVTAQYYYKRSAMVAVINRINIMLDQYADSPHTADGLAVLARAHLALGNTQLAEETIKVLELNHPQHGSLREFKKVRG
ncbi:hypothetical protein AB833_11570 [Chromatiales bacterium (ex Bugula neritina AB1)]|nr:hypothetical protein AB833_11570 [Chromatiales bacterium (ex Bugula neritina AB1)]